MSVLYVDLANSSTRSRFPASENLNEMADAVVDFDAYVDVALASLVKTRLQSPKKQNKQR